MTLPFQQSAELQLWEIELKNAGVGRRTIKHYRIKESRNGDCVTYPCQYPPVLDSEGKMVFHEVWRHRTLPHVLEVDPSARRFHNPIQDNCPGGEMPLFYTPDYLKLKKAIAKANGHLELFEGDKDQWTAFEAGIDNASSILSAGGSIDDRLALQFRDLGVKTIAYYPDNDHAGWGVAAQLKEVMQRWNIVVSFYHVPWEVNGVHTKDTSDMYRALAFDSAIFVDNLHHLRVMVIQTRAELDRENSGNNGSPFDEALYEAIEQFYGFDGFNQDGWSKRQIACPFGNHEHDAESPAFGWNHKLHIGRCFKCGDKNWYLTKEVAEAAGIDWREYVKHRNETAPLEAGRLQDSPYLKQSPVAGAGSILKSANPYLNVPPRNFLYTLNDVFDSLERRLDGKEISPYPPILNPIKPLHNLGGAAMVLPRPFLGGLLGVSGGFKTSFLFGIILELLSKGYRGVIWTPEWTLERNANRLAQMFGGMNMGEMSLLELEHYQRAYGLPSFTPDMDFTAKIAQSKQALKRMRSQLKENLIFVKDYGEDIFDVLYQIEAAVAWMNEMGTPPDFMIFDYAQLASPPLNMRNTWTVDDTVARLKKLTYEYGLLTFVSSQVRKSDTEGTKKGEDVLTTSSGVFFTEHKFNLFLGLYPLDEYIEVGETRYRIIKLKVLKNSDGGTADSLDNAIEMYVDLKRLVVLSTPYDEDSVVFNLSEEDVDVIEALKR